MTTGRRVAGLAAAFLLLAGGAAASAADLKPIKALIPIPNIDESFAPVVVAKYLGYFEQEGLSVTLLPVRGSNEAAIQVSAGNADVGLASPADAIIGMQPGKDLDVQYFYDLYYQNIWPLSVPAASPIQTAAELKGKKIGVLSMGSTAISFGRAYAKEAGLDPAKDLTFIPIGVGAQAITAIRQGVVDAIIFNDSALVKTNAGGIATRRIPISDKLRDLPDTSILARRKTIIEQREAMIGFARAIAKGYHFTLANPAAAVKITWKVYPEAEPKSLAPADALAQGIAVATARMAIWSSPKTKGVDGGFVESDWRNLQDFLVGTDLLKRPLPSDRVYTTALLPEINRFDRDAIAEQARKYDPGTVR